MGGRSKSRAAEIRYFVDENDLALGKALAAVRPDAAHPGHLRLPEVPRGTKDPERLPIIGAMGLVVITRDKHIRRRPVEKRLWCEHGIRGFVLTGKTSQSSRDGLGILVRRRSAIEHALR